MQQRTCIIPNCDRPARSRTAEWCKMHYHRWYRHGSTDAVARSSGITASHGRRYRALYVPGHPLARANGRAYEHRVVLYAVIGEGPHTCHWCTTTIDWLPKGEPNALQVDHLNAIGDDNRPGNLVPACSACNTTRGSQARSDALREAGWWSHHDTVARLQGGRAARVA